MKDVLGSYLETFVIVLDDLLSFVKKDEILLHQRVERG